MSGKVKFKDFSMTFKAMYLEIQGVMVRKEGAQFNEYETALTFNL
jgi:hypothetical protein